jgi:hypothetical protein
LRSSSFCSTKRESTLSADDKMGELVDLFEWKMKKELDEIDRLKAEIRDIQESEGLPDQSPYYPKEYFDPTNIPIYSREDQEDLVESYPPGYFQFEPLQFRVDYNSAQDFESITLPKVGPDAGLGPGVAFRAGERVRDLVDLFLRRELSITYPEDE